jgi:uncharacterized protein YukE
VASGGFEVAPSKLDSTAATYRQQAEVVRNALAAFQAKADLPPSAFGRLPESAQLASEYQTFLRRVVQDVTQLHEALSGGAIKLHLSAAEYRAADRAAAVGDV